jgi:O6-methylguanine-DNA--protein-cysteine methyltransferase
MAVNLNPTLSYQSPFMSSVPGKEKVRTSFGSHVQEYDFGKATSTEVNNNPKGSTHTYLRIAERTRRITR